MRRYFLLLVLVAVCAQAQVEGKFSLPKSEYASGEPVWLAFELKNIGPDTIYYNAGDRYSFCGGYRVEITKGALMAHPSCNTGMAGSCISTTHELRSGHGSTDRLLLNYDHDLATPGRYHLKATYYIGPALTNEPTAVMHAPPTHFGTPSHSSLTRSLDSTLPGVD